MRIALAGVGGIGSNVALNLVRSGVDQLLLVDFDHVEASNLNRQFYFADQIGMFKVEALAINLTRINPSARLEPLVKRIDATNCTNLFQEADLVVEGFDRSSDKKMLLETLGAEKIIVSASGIAGSELAPITARRFGKGCIAGDFITDCAQAQLYSHKVTTVANYMTEFILDQAGVFHA
ncbi:sulfur carrier protein ThiS adenylyltransferase ThiF [Desulfobulbus rhabdoformis]|uniref:sulfur carrier protein ThiS adenylyltransferase ThiF n=1 Tax=Desulfobulbus rhabdoformis TaxID=34032 RepID=UPI001964FF2E|nr:sulfur carrier protein ThiS adenylyltransferase ThiF [Desulfobulbus rhabdoformis]MBM9613962.1 sulfur carrier protein ThiS adenylyltransferase ThiF [Desulfobulbus rhabdoformis]